MTRQVPEPGQGIIMWKVIEKRMKEKMDGSMFIGTWWSLVPPLLAIVLAFLTKEVYSALFVGVAVGALLYTGFSPWDSFVSFFEIMKDSMNLNILIFDVLLGMIIVLMAKSGLWKLGRKQDQEQKKRASCNNGTWGADFCR